MDDGSLRYFTLRECARIQSFPDEHFFTGSRSKVVRQIGNAVPCVLAAAVARPLFEAMELFGVLPTQKPESRAA
jgi:DNA (cytosine-5)-methyltransferase 1